MSHDHHDHHDHDAHDHHGHEEPGDFSLDEALEHDDEPIEPAGILNDLVLNPDGNEAIDITEFFPFRDAVAIAHNPHRIWNDMKQGTASAINLSERLVLRVEGKPTARLLDLYSGSQFAPSLLSSFTRKAVTPRFRYVDLFPALPDVPDTAVDVRTLESHEPGMLHPDIFAHVPPLSKRIRRWRKKHGRKALKASGGFALGALIATLLLVALANSVKAITVDGYTRLIALKEMRDPAAISQEIDSLQDEFHKADLLFSPLGMLVDLGIARSDNLENAAHAIRGGKALLDGLVKLDSIRNQLAGGVHVGSGSTLEYADPRLLTANVLPLTDIFESRETDLTGVRDSLLKSVLEFGSVNDLQDPEKEEKLVKAVNFLESIERTLDFTLKHRSEIFALLGDKVPKHYLVLNQNRDELRANGGFPGSAIELVFYKGRLQSYEKKDIYFYDWRLFPFGETPPPGIDKITNMYGMRDANYYPDFKESFATISRMYEKAGGSTLDGIVAINQGIVTDLLKITGPIQVAGIKEPVTADNFSLILSVLVEWEIGRKTSAKDILFSFMEAFETRLRELGDYTNYLDVLERNVASGEIVMADRDADLDAFVHQYIPDDAYKGRSDNFVYPVFTSISGNKSDRYVHRTFTLSSRAFSGCTAINTFDLKSSHDFGVGTRESIRKMLFDYGVPTDNHEHELFVQWNGENVEYIRLLTPKGSVLKTHANVTVDTDDSHADYTSFAFTVHTKVLENTDISFDYTSTPKTCDPKPEFLKQPGLQHYNVDIR